MSTASNPISLLVTAGDGPAECAQAIGHILNEMRQEADGLALILSINIVETKHGPKSAVVVVHGAEAARFARSWCGTIKWRMQSQIRKHHKRANWFVGVFRMENVSTAEQPIFERDISYSTLRAGGPGGQHQNTTESAVRAVHAPSGLSVVVRDGRSQHRNKALALERLRALANADAQMKAEQGKSAQNALHHQLERGNPIRCYSGMKFRRES